MSDPDQASTRPARNLPNLSNLFDTLEEKKIDSLRDLSKPSALSTSETKPLQVKAPFQADSDAPLRLSPELQVYLPPDLWRKLSVDAPRSGIYINALERLNSLLYTISTYLPADLVQEKLNRPIPGLVDGRILRGCLLFSDVSGFTALSERLATLGPQGAEHLTGFINQYFTTMIDIVSWSNGTLLKFAGDATLIYFPQQENEDHVRWAARAGLRMLRAMSDFKDIATPLGAISLSMKLGLAAGDFLAASVGSPKRMEYALIGETVTETMQAESNSASGLLVINQKAAAVLRAEYKLTEAKPGFFRLAPETAKDLDAFEIRPQKRRARSSMPWDASLEELNVELDNSLGKIQALAPYLPSELLDRIVSHASQRQVESEYRPTAVMFCNFTGPEILLEKWGDSGAQRVTGLMSAYFNDMNEAISRFGGIVSRIDPYSKGTKLLALFGAPIAHEDDPQRAVSAGLAMNTALQALNRRWAQKLSRHLPQDFPEDLIQHRIGITIGETFAGQAGSATRREYTVMGDEVNLAARLMSAAEPGQILISEAVLERVKTYYVTRKLPAVRVKGKKKAINIFQVDGPREDTLLNRIQTRDQLIGRKDKLEEAWQSFERARIGQGGILALTGPAGLGKSHLADTLLKRAMQADWQVEAFQCRSYQAEESLSCWIGLLRLLADMTPLDHPLIQAEKLERLTTQLGITSEQNNALVILLGLRQIQIENRPEASPTGDDLFKMVKQGRASRKASNLDVFEQLDNRRASAPTETSRLANRQSAKEQDGLQALLAGLAAQSPLVIFFEDSHWMDDSSRETLLLISQKLAAKPILFLLAGRLHEGLPENLPRIELPPFRQEETSAMAAAILTEGLTQIIHEQSNGSPLFVEEISRWIKRTHSIDQDGLKSILQSSDILQKLVLSSLESLPENQRELARLASIVGMEFRRSEIEALLEGQDDPVSLSNNLNSLAQSHLVSLIEASVDPRYAFQQAIFRDVLYTSLPFERRREMHASMAEHLKTRPTQRRQLRDKIAAFLEDTPIKNPLREAEILAYHLEMSENWLEAAQQWNNAAEILSTEQAGSELPLSKALAILDRIPPEAATTPEVGLQKARAHSGKAWLSLRQNELPAATAASQAALQAALLTALPSEISSRLAACLALCWPSQAKTTQAEKHISEYLESQPNLPDIWKFNTLQAWLAWRAERDPLSLAASALEKLPQTETDSNIRARALLNELGRSWEQAISAYQSLNANDCAALGLVRWGDSLLAEGDSEAAGNIYQRANEIWQKTGAACGLALAAYRRAELRQANPRTSLLLLEESLSWLEKSPPVLQTGPRVIVQNALARLKKRQPGPWAIWRWQPFDDLAYINLLMPLF